MYVCKGVLTVSTRLKVCTGKGTDICEFAQREVHTQKYFSYDMKYVYLWDMSMPGEPKP